MSDIPKTLDVVNVDALREKLTSLWMEGHIGMRDAEALAHGLQLWQRHETTGLHCATCQCNKLNPTPPAPDNPRSKSWHENADHAPPK